MNKKQKRIFIRIIISLIIFIIALIFPKSIYKKLLFIIAYIISGYDIIIKAFRSVFNLRILDENFLMFVASLGAFLIDEFPEACAVSLFYQTGELFQSYAVSKSRRHIKELFKIKPQYANLEVSGKIVKVKPENVNVGDIILISDGEKIPLDGVVVSGEALIDTSSITGESMPLHAFLNTNIQSGCICIEGVIKLRVTNKYADSTVSKILDLLTQSTQNKSKSEKFITRFSKYYTPFVVCCAVVLGGVIPLIFPVDTSAWIRKALVFLVVSCPCALVISIPLSFFGGIGCASKNKILVKGSEYIEKLSKVHTVVFDKTGTITTGRLIVKKIHSPDIIEEELIKISAYAEYYNTHPVSLAIKNLYNKTTDTNEIKNYKNHMGMGVTAEIFGYQVVLGNERLFSELNIPIKNIFSSETVIYISLNGKYSGYFLISDEIKEDTKKAVELIGKCGVKRTVLLTGDKKEIGEKIGAEAGISEIHTQLLPQDKVLKAKKLKASLPKSSTIAFVGDGANDAPVLSFCDVGISMGGIGSDISVEASDFVIMDDNPLKLEKAIRISKYTMKIAKENIFISIFVKFLFLFLGALGFSGLWGAVFADVGVSVIAILNAFRTLKYKA